MSEKVSDFSVKYTHLGLCSAGHTLCDNAAVYESEKVI